MAPRDEVEARVYDLKGVNPNGKVEVDERRPAQILDEIEANARDLADALAELRALLAE